jgi:hypothetical protein
MTARSAEKGTGWMRNNLARRLVALAGAFAFTAVATQAAPSSDFSRLDSLFLVAASGEPRFAGWRDSSEKVLVAEGAQTLSYLASTAGHDRTPRQRHYVERLFTLVADSGRNPAAREILIRAILAAPNDTLRARWLYIGSRIGDTVFRDAALPWLNVESGLVRRNATRVLGAYPRPENIPLLLAGLDTLRGPDRFARLWALEGALAKDSAFDWKVLTPLLADTDSFNRRKVRDILLKATDSSWTALRVALPRNRDPSLRREWRLLALDARKESGGRDFLRAEANRMTQEEKSFLGLESAEN